MIEDTTKEIKYNNLLIKFCTKLEEAYHNDWTTNPFTAFDRDMSTNKQCLITLPKFRTDLVSFEDKIKSVYSILENINHNISIYEIKYKLSKFPQVECYDEILDTCDACYGCGNVDFEFEYNSKIYTSTEQCPICEGYCKALIKSDKPNGKTKPDDTKYFKIGICCFSLEKINDILYVADELNVDNIKLVYQEKPSKPSMFQIGEAELLIMPVLMVKDDNIAAEIKIND